MADRHSDGRRTRVAGTTYTAQGLEWVRAWSLGDRVRCRGESIVSSIGNDVDSSVSRPAGAEAPAGFRQEATTQGAVVLSWEPSVDNVGVVGYGVQRHAILTDTPSDPIVTLTGLVCGSTYRFTVDAVDAAGNRSSSSSAWVQTAECGDGCPLPHRRICQSPPHGRQPLARLVVVDG